MNTASPCYEQPELQDMNLPLLCLLAGGRCSGAPHRRPFSSRFLAVTAATDLSLGKSSLAHLRTEEAAYDSAAMCLKLTLQCLSQRLKASVRSARVPWNIEHDGSRVTAVHVGHNPLLRGHVMYRASPSSIPGVTCKRVGLWTNMTSTEFPVVSLAPSPRRGPRESRAPRAAPSTSCAASSAPRRRSPADSR